MTPALLVQAIAEEITAAVKDYELKAEGQEDKSVSVYQQHIPDEKFQDDSYYPLVIAAWQGSKDEDEGSTATIGLTFGAYGSEPDAWMDLMSIMERVRQRLLENRLLKRRYRLALPTKWETIEEQPYPYWFGYATLNYQIGQPSERVPDSFYENMEEDT